jgi:hypothetical protein
VASKDGTLPKSLKWVAVGLNVVLLCTEGVLLSTRGVTVNEIAMVSMLVATPVLNLALFLDYYRRGLWTA